MVEVMTYRKRRTIVVAAVIFAATLLGGCAGAQYGGLRPSPEAAQIFESGQVLPQYRYYTTGAQNIPDAVIAVDRKYTLLGTTWREEEMTEKRLRRLVFNLKQYSSGLTDFPFGMKVVGPKGEAIGHWYSDLTFTTVTMPSATEVVIQSPATIRSSRPDLQRAVDRS